MIQIGGVYTTVCQEEGILLQKYRDRNGRCIAILFKCIGVRGRFDPPEVFVKHIPPIRWDMYNHVVDAQELQQWAAARKGADFGEGDTTKKTFSEERLLRGEGSQ